ncbi:hypothetical protein [Mucilaginibacter gilvus]|uniref:Uncharacterized protein n=1 Tax=Mucilaginibacter gilvus TaxID=2305909 RepID=A0A444MJK4_9SPHI|nr:hypothetical protein [Mucilaginibacter gilvus]RWY48515.1 hypothetical protein EPL05_19365 [Mucilaginibacter gilvus]
MFLKSHLTHIFRLLFAVLLVTSPFMLYAQQPDSLAVTFVKTPVLKVVLPDTQNGNAQPGLFIQGVRFNQVRTLTVIIQNGKEESFSINEGHELMVSLGDSTAVIMTTPATIYSSFGGSSNGYYVSTDYNLSESDFLALLDHGLTAIDLEYSGGTFSFKLNSIQAAEFKKGMLLLK